MSLGAIRQATGVYTWGFLLLAGFSVLCWLICWRTGSGRTSTVPA